VVIAILGIMLGVVLASFSSLSTSYVLEGETKTLVSLLGDARSRTLAGRDGFQYGVHFGTSSATLFRGGSYTVGDSTNETMTLNQKVRIGTTTFLGGGSDIIFTKVRGTATYYGTTTLYLANNQSANMSIVIKENGLVEVR